MNYFDMKLLATSKNEAFARNAVASFAIECSPTLEEINDIKTAVSEEKDTGVMQIECSIPDDKKSIEIVVRDFGKGIKDVKEAVEPFFTTAQDDERSGMGFTIIDTFMDEMDVASVVGDGTVVKMKKVMKGC